MSKEKLEGSTTDFVYFWDEVYGWIHFSEEERLKEAYRRFRVSPKGREK